MTNIVSNLTAKVAEITPKIASEYLEHLYENQRPEAKGHTDYLVEAMELGLFDPTSDVAFAICNGKKVLIDGQHTLRAIEKSALSQSLPVKHFYVKSENDIARLYSHYNIGKTRSFIDSIRAYDIPKKTGLTSTQINQTASAIRYQLQGFPPTSSRSKKQHEEMIERVEAWKDNALIFFNEVSGAEKLIRNRICSVPILSVCLIILKYCPKKGVEFIQLAHDDGLRKDDPRKALLHYFSYTRQSTQSGHKRQEQGKQARAVAKCWGKFYSDLTLSRVHLNSLATSARKNIVIKGTPYTGKFPTVG